MDWALSGLPFLTEPGALLDGVAKAIRSVTGRETTPSTSGGTSDGRFIATLGTQVVELGPVNATIHQVDEHILASDLDLLTDQGFLVKNNVADLRADWGRLSITGTAAAPLLEGRVDVEVRDGEYSSTLSGGYVYALGLLKGDANGNGFLSIADAVYLLGYLFRGAEAPFCLALGDANGDAALDIGDVTFLLAYLFGDGPAPAPERVDCR